MKMISLSSLLHLAIKNISGRKIRSTLSVLGILIGIILYTSVTVATESFQKEVSASISYLQGAIFIQQKGVPTPVLSSINRSLEKELYQKFGDKILGISPQIWYINGSTFSLYRSMVIVGVYPENDSKTGGYLTKVDWGGREPPKNNERGWIVLGSKIAEVLGLQIGDRVGVGAPPRNITLTVIGIYSIGGITDYLAIASILDIDYIDLYHDLNKTVSSYIVKMSDPRYTDEFVNYIKEYHPELEIILQEDLSSRAAGVLNLVEKFSLLIAALAFSIGTIGIMNTVMMNVSERRKEIGILKATGWSNREVMIEIFFESFILGVIGTILGIILGIEIVYFGVEYFKLQLHIIVELSLIIRSLALGLTISFVGGLPPSWRAMNISPIESLRE